MAKGGESRRGFPDVADYSHYTDEDLSDQLGTLPPGVLVLAEYPKFPYYPAYVMSGAEARRQEGLRDDVRNFENGQTPGSFVRFFASNTCAFLKATCVEPLIVNEYVLCVPSVSLFRFVSSTP